MIQKTEEAVKHEPDTVREEMFTLSTVELRANLSDVLGRVRHAHERIVITKSGKPVAGIIPYDELEAIEALEEELDRKALTKARKEGGRHLLEDVKKELGLA
ncbi:MAG TPA: type II toxin-antitoxin system Phd/YefM family antitoxin [Rhodothermales bacterium]|nr:type II toxin-antitoxin system Phd/YefM family antitoxin [Rhodothermales bacterium]